MSAFVNQSFDEDEESDNDFQPGVQNGSDAGDDSGDEKQALRTKTRLDSDDEQAPLVEAFLATSMEIRLLHLPNLSQEAPPNQTKSRKMTKKRQMETMAKMMKARAKI